MKKILFFLFIIFLYWNCNEKEPAKTESGYDKFYEKHEHDAGVVTVGMPVFVFKLFVDRSDKNVSQAVDHIETIDLFVKENSDSLYFKEVYVFFPGKTYKTLMSSNDANAEVKFLIKELNEKVDELIGIIDDKENQNCVVLRVGGKFELKDIETLAEKINISEIAGYR
jgi:hypothetical protein